MLHLNKPVIIDVDTPETAAHVAANFVMSAMREKSEPTVVFPTGNTPRGMYNYLATHHKNDSVWQSMTYLQLDEYAGLQLNDERSFSRWVGRELLDHVGHPETRRVTFNIAADPEDEAARMRALLEREQITIDLLVLGIGHNGHIGFNEPGAPFEKTVHVQQLDSSTISANAGYWGGVDRVPTRAITLGVETLRKARRTMLLVTGHDKHAALFNALHGPVSESCPASILQIMPNVTVIADRAALDM